MNNDKEDPPSKRRRVDTDNQGCGENNIGETCNNDDKNLKHKLDNRESEFKSNDSQLPKEMEQEASEDVSTSTDEQSTKDGAKKVSTENDKERASSSTAVNNDKYENYVNPEELQKLRQFQVLDEVKSNDEESNEEDSDSSDDDNNGNSEGVPEDEIEKMLDEELPEELRGAPKQKEKPFSTRKKIVLEEKGVNQFEVLPLDWMMARHYSGMPVYMHRTTRVCTLSKPYFLGKGNTRRHDIPISAIPCLAYRKALEEEEKQKELDKHIEEQIKNATKQMSDNNKATNTNTLKCPFIQKMTAKKVTKDIQEVDNNVGDSNSKTDCNKVSIDTNVCKCPVNHDSKNTDKQDDENQDTSNKDEISEISKTTSSQEKDSANKTDSCQSIENDQVMECDDWNEIPVNNDKSNSIEDEKANTVEISNEVSVNGQMTVDNDEVKADENGQEPSKEHNSLENNKEGSSKDETPRVKPVVLPGGIVMPPPRVETVSTSWKTQHLTPEQVNDYCKRLFKFKTVNIMHFKRWADRRKYTKARKTLQYPTLPEGTKLITIPHVGNGTANTSGKAIKRDWVMNMNGRSYLSVFHEYVRQALEKQPVYEFKQLENASMPYQATVYIGGMQYGVGHGSSKRAAKAAAARASIKVLIPEMATDLDPPQQDEASEPDFSFFDYVGIEDPRITEFCAATCEPSPHAILRTCLLRNFGTTDRHIHTEMEKLEYQKIKLTMKVGKHTASVVCKNKKTAKQRASQAILQALHPHVRSWGSLLRLYGTRSVKSCKEKKEEEQQITLLQDAARQNEPNYAVLEKLRNEMRKLRERDEAVVPIGTLLVKDDLPTHSGSNLNNVDL